jgi:hypothetical protein
MVLALSFLAIVALTALAWAMGFRAQPLLDGESARAEAEGRLAGFIATNVVLAADGRGALLQGRDGSLGLLLPLADGWIARRVSLAAVSCTEGRLTAQLGEPMLPEARLRLAACPHWIAPAA